jgi:hypothetical protein
VATLREIGSKSEVYREFVETRRWDVLHGRKVIGQIWRALRHADNVVCWMIKPAAIDFSMPQSFITGGYRATQKKGAIDDLLDWHQNADLNHATDGWTLHCYRDWHGAALHRALDETRSYLAIHPEIGMRWISASYNQDDNQHLGMMGPAGWHVSGRRGTRTVIVHQAASVEEGLDTLISVISLPATEEEKKSRMMTDTLPVERHFGSLVEKTITP